MLLIAARQEQLPGNQKASFWSDSAWTEEINNEEGRLCGAGLKQMYSVLFFSLACMRLQGEEHNEAHF